MANNYSPKSTLARNILISVVVLLALLIGVLYYMDYRAEFQREERAYELLQDCSNPDFYEDFILRFPKSEHVDEVRERYKEVAAQQDEWATLIVKGGREELQQFVRLHPTSPYVRLANNRIDSLDWADAKQKRTLEAVTRYMSLHADGFYIGEAETLRQTLERTRAEVAMLAAQQDSLAADSMKLQ